MTVQQIIDRARRLGYVDSSQYSDVQAIEDFNIIYHDIENTIISDVREDFFWDYFNADTVVNQEEYVLPDNLSGDYTGLYKNLGISIKYNTIATAPTVARRVYPYQLPRDVEWYKQNQSQSDPIFHISDKSAFIYPAPTEAITDGLKIYGIQNLKDLTISDIADDIFVGNIPTKFYNIISLGMLEYVYQARGMIQEAINAKNRYELSKRELVSYIKQRNPSVIQITAPNLSHLY